MEYIFYTIRFIWELPQNLLGILIYFLNWKKITSVRITKGRLLFENSNFGISLGSFIFWTPLPADIYAKVPINMKHEFGHSIQSQLFGPLYLIFIGLPSISRVFYSRMFYALKKKEWTNYYKGYPEKWADSLGIKHYKV